MVVPGRERADHDYGGKRVPGGVHGGDGGLNDMGKLRTQCIEPVFRVRTTQRFLPTRVAIACMSGNVYRHDWRI